MRNTPREKRRRRFTKKHTRQRHGNQSIIVAANRLPLRQKRCRDHGEDEIDRTAKSRTYDENRGLA